MLDKFGRDVALIEDERGAVYTLLGWELVLPQRDDVRALDLAAMFETPPPPAQPLDRAALIAKIDAAVKAIFERAAPPVIGDIYKEREAAALAFKNVGYPADDVPQRIAEFQVPAGLTAQVATDLILTQAAQLRGARDLLEALRMRKYEVQNAATDEIAQTTGDAILAQIAGIGANLS